MGALVTSWGWPQWTAAVILLLRVFYAGHNHGEPRLEIGGARKGQPLRYNGFVTAVGAVATVIVLAAGGFYG